MLNIIRRRVLRHPKRIAGKLTENGIDDQGGPGLAKNAMECATSAGFVVNPGQPTSDCSGRGHGVR
jgi:hypothetical protein